MIITRQGSNGTVTVSDGSHVGLILTCGAIVVTAVVAVMVHSGHWLLNRATVFDGIFFGSLIVFMLMFHRRTDATIDPTAQSLTYRRKRLYSSDSKTIPLSSVTHVHLKRQTIGRGPTAYQLCFSTSNGEHSFQIKNERDIKNAVHVFENLKTVLPHAKFDTDSVVSAYQNYQPPHLKRNLRNGLRVVPFHSWASLILGPIIFLVVPKLTLWNQLAGGNILWIVPFIIGGGLIFLGIVSFLQTFYGDLTETIMRPFQ